MAVVEFDRLLAMMRWLIAALRRLKTNERVAAFATVSTHSASAWLVGESISRFDQKLLLLQMLQGSDGMTVAKVTGGGRKVMILQRNLCVRMEQSAVSARAGG